ncbi:hypothetical protein VNO77_08582 [Canavalia gladiata]|uniref:Uncharacterized protein n=1 Tax=Canavalia gladiata TaxID=3824 RepID=A0AAN9QX31_CANGL
MLFVTVADHVLEEDARHSVLKKGVISHAPHVALGKPLEPGYQAEEPDKPPSKPSTATLADEPPSKPISPKLHNKSQAAKQATRDCP